MYTLHWGLLMLVPRGMNRMSPFQSSSYGYRINKPIAVANRKFLALECSVTVSSAYSQILYP